MGPLSLMVLRPPQHCSVGFLSGKQDEEVSSFHGQNCAVEVNREESQMSDRSYTSLCLSLFSSDCFIAPTTAYILFLLPSRHLQLYAYAPLLSVCLCLRPRAPINFLFPNKRHLNILNLTEQNHKRAMTA